ncbi:DNA polymerase III subunit alpha [Rickettsiales bacterium]|nr:DNA polymerase III subunit alpha [Rickettsiales bacterium]
MAKKRGFSEDSFVHLRVHSAYSLAEGAVKIDELVSLAKTGQMPAVAITDSGNMFGALEFSMAASKEGIQPIIGCIIKVQLENNQAESFKDPIYDKVLLIAQNDEGYGNLLKLVSNSFANIKNETTPHIKIDDLFALNKGLILLTGGASGPLGRLILDAKPDKAKKLLSKLYDVFKDRLYIEIIRHGTKAEEKTEDLFIKWAYELNIPLVATNEVYFPKQNMHQAHDALLCIAAGTYVDEQERRKVSDQCFFKTTRQMKTLFADLPEAVNNTAAIARRCAVMAYPHDPMLPHFSCEGGRDEAEELKAIAEKGLIKRLEDHVFTENMSQEEKDKIALPYKERMEYELGIITQMKFPGYFLIVSDFMRWGKRHDVPIGPGRGSGAGSVVAWVLEITDLDPLRFGLLFERFLNPERISMPDFDIDFCQERREEVIRYVQQKYGADKVAQIITFGKLQAKAVLRDVGRVLQLPYSQVDRISKMIPFNPLDPITLEKALKMDRNLSKMKEDDPEVNRLMTLAMQLEGLYRHASTHAAGVVIADRPLDEMVPVYRDPRSDMPVSGYSMKYTEASGLVKFDFLGLKTLTVIAKTCAFLKKRDIDIDVSKLPLEDKKTFELLSAGNTVGAFQLESAGMRDTLRKLRPDNIDDIIAIISLYRPGPMDNIPSYIARKHGTEEPDYLHTMLEPVLKETYGVIIYQEQVMQVAQIMGGYTLGGADLLRRAMGKKIASEMDKQRKIFVEGAVANKVDKKTASSIFDLVAKFAGYGFNKSHAAAYAMISYQTAYLKANYPVEFLAASMNLDINDTDKINVFRQDIVEQKITTLLPDINKSEALFVPEKMQDGKYAIRYALGALKNVGVAAMEELVAERRKNGEFKDLFDLVGRLGSKVINKRQLENLIRSGACDGICDNRKQAYENIETLIRYGTMVAQERQSNQVSLFGGGGTQDIDKPKLAPIADWKGVERLAHEFAAIGMYLSSHPITSYDAILGKMSIQSFRDLEENAADGNISAKMAGVLASKKIKSSARGRYANIVLSDPTGLFEVAIYDGELLGSVQEILENGNVLYLSVNARKDDGGIRIIADSICLLDEVAQNQRVALNIKLKNTDNIELLNDFLQTGGNNASKIRFILNADGKNVEIELPENYYIKPSDIEEIRSLEAIESVFEV